MIQDVAGSQSQSQDVNVNFRSPFDARFDISLRPRLAANTAGTNRLGILEPTTLAKKEPEQASRGAVSLFIMAQNLNLSMLSAKSELAASFRSIIQEDIARELGPGFTSEHVDVRLLAESAAIPVTITAPSGVSCHDLHRWLCNKPLRWGATDATGAGGGNTLATLVSQGFSAVCLSPSWCLCTIGMPSIVADEASTTVSGGSPLDGKMRGLGLSQDLPAVPDEQDLILPRSLQRSGHTPRDAAKPPRASPKRRPMAKVGILGQTGQTVKLCQIHNFFREHNIQEK